MQTVDFKCECPDPSLAALLLRRAGAAFIASVAQVDTYFRAPDASLMRRQSSPGRDDGTVRRPTLATPLPNVEWVYFSRLRRIEPRVTIATLYTEQAALARFGAAPMPMSVIVQKERRAWALGDVRVHLDEVEGLGTFAEFEARVGQRRSAARCVAQVGLARAAMRLALGEPLACGYGELMEQEQELALRDCRGAPIDLAT